MPNRRYVKGYRFERKVVELLKKHGWVAFRCPASRPFDVVALKKGYTPILIECKNTLKFDKKRLEEQEKLAEKAGAMFIVVTPRNLDELLELIEEEL